MKILSLTEDQYELLKNQYEDELEMALKYVDDIKSILFKLKKQENKIDTVKKTRKRRKTKKTILAKSAVAKAEPVKKTGATGKKRGRKPKNAKPEPAPVKKTRKVKAKPGPKKKVKKIVAKKAVVSKAAPVKAKPVRKKRKVVKAKPAVSAKSTETQSSVKTYINPEVKKDE
jgi:hypothetical protein